MVFRPKEGVNIHYVHALLRLKSLREHAALHFTGSAGHQRVSDEFFKGLDIPMPPLEKQNEIVMMILEMKAQARSLESEANEGLEQAKREVEAMILGEGSVILEGALDSGGNFL